LGDKNRPSYGSYNSHNDVASSGSKSKEAAETGSAKKKKVVVVGERVIEGKYYPKEPMRSDTTQKRAGKTDREAIWNSGLS